MMKMLVRVAVGLALVFVAWHVGHAQAQLADFRIVIEPSARGAQLECLKGCSWKTTSFKCDPAGRACKWEVDQNGIGVAGQK